jgi:hypothetical protein
LPGEEEQFTRLYNGLLEDFNPQRQIDYEILTDVVLCRLRSYRIDQTDTKEFAKATIEKEERRPILDNLRPAMCIAALEHIRKLIQDRGPRPEDLAGLRDYYQSEPTRRVQLAMLEVQIGAQQQRGSGDDSYAEQFKKAILNLLDIEIADWQLREGFQKCRDIIEYGPGLQEPPSQMLDNLIRYRAANLREFKDLLDCLERVRRLRRDAA